MDEEFDALEGFFYVLEHGILELLENVETYLHHLQVGCMCSTLCQLIDTGCYFKCFDIDMFKPNNCISVFYDLNSIEILH